MIILARELGLPFYRRLTIPLALLAFGLMQFPDADSLFAIRHRLAGLSSVAGATMFAALVGAWSLIVGKALEPTWQMSFVDFLSRQPISKAQWLRFSCVLVWPALFPVAILIWFMPVFSDQSVAYFSFGFLVWSLVLQTSRSGSQAVVSRLAILVMIWSAAFLGAEEPMAMYLILPASLFLAIQSSSFTSATKKRSRIGKRNHYIRATPIGALVKRDLICLWRTERKAIYGLLQIAAFPALLMFAVALNGNAIDTDAFRLACILAVLSLAPVNDALTRLRTTLRSQFYDAKWPITPSQRSIAFIGVVMALSLPTTLFMSAAAFTMGMALTAVFFLYVFASLMLIGAISVASATGREVTIGWALILLICHCTLSVTLQTPLYCIISIILIVLSYFSILRSMHRSVSNFVNQAIG